MRGRLIPAATFLVEVAQLDAQLGDQTLPGMDRVFREPKVGIDPLTNQRVLGRKERTIKLPAQIETGDYRTLVVLATGIAPRSNLTLVFDYRDFEERGMIHDKALTTPIRVTDRLVAIYSTETWDLLIAFPNPPGIFCEKATPDGLRDGYLNLLVTEWKDRPQGRPQGA